MTVERHFDPTTNGGRPFYVVDGLRYATRKEALAAAERLTIKDGSAVTILPATTAGAQRPATVVDPGHPLTLVRYEDGTTASVPNFRIVV